VFFVIALAVTGMGATPYGANRRSDDSADARQRIGCDSPGATRGCLLTGLVAALRQAMALRHARRSSARSSSSRDCFRHRWRPGFQHERTSYTPWSPGSLPPRSAAHFAFVRPVELVSRPLVPRDTVQPSGASPVFGPQNPLRAGLLSIAGSFSVTSRIARHLKALASSCSSPCGHPQLHAFALDDMDRSGLRSRHRPLPCPPPRSIRVDLVAGPAGFELEHRICLIRSLVLALPCLSTWGLFVMHLAAPGSMPTAGWDSDFRVCIRTAFN
jgi:hypothetical protein